MEECFYIDLEECSENENFYYLRDNVLHISELATLKPEDRTETIKNMLRYKHLEADVRAQIESLITEFSDCFHLEGEELGATNIIHGRIPTCDDIPVVARPYRFPYNLREEMEKIITKLILNGTLEPSDSNYSSPAFLREKTPDSKGRKRYRMVVDFKLLNAKTQAFNYPMPNILDVIDHVGGSTYFSTFDLAHGFFQVPLDKQDRHKTAFMTPFGAFQFRRIAMGLRRSPGEFQRALNEIFKGLQFKEVYLFLDDAVIHSKTIEEHIAKLRKFLERLRSSNLKLQPDKCEFLQSSVIHLGHKISAKVVEPDPKKLKAVSEYKIPKTVKQV